MKIKEAILLRKSLGHFDLDKMLEELWPGSNHVTRKVLWFRLETGRTAKVNPEWIRIICRHTGVDANYLFNL